MVAVEARPAGALRTVEQAVEHVHAICFKTGPPRLIGVELEWTVQHRTDPHRSLNPDRLRAALAAHAPASLDPHAAHQPLPHGGVITVEPGGQVEISTPPADSLATLLARTAADIDYLTELLAQQGLSLGPSAIDPYRAPRRILHTPRYDAMAAAFARQGSSGQVMMCATAATQVCLDAGEPGQLTSRWAALHALGPPLLALFANSARHAGDDTGWASARMRAWLRTDPPRTWPVGLAPDPATAWARYALAAPLLCVRHGDPPWRPAPGLSFADWVDGGLTPAPTVDDLEYHLGTLFPPVRPRGYVEVRYLDAQPPQRWYAPVAVLAALLADDATTDAARGLAAPVAGAWTTAAWRGLADPAVRAAAAAVADLALRRLDRTDLTGPTRDAVADIVSRRLAGRGE
jgi:glutamate--cysteine ligase